jgi:hypothetical protein
MTRQYAPFTRPFVKDPLPPLPGNALPGYLWNPTTQELIPILPGNQAIRLAAIERWDKVKETSK